ncbi:hypothetical protein AVEN_121236-1 [Araneus ventricosus]|uniref:Uncharacterized protein n=1 Tax=Araneus ventricosus TaxID=182803 RepID=A0A4Y2TDK7_ARAVE|nr:hypothetical protein AVEN_121236-1 [Araneus ventricosus]
MGHRYAQEQVYNVSFEYNEKRTAHAQGIPKIWRCFDVPMGHPYTQNQVYNVMVSRSWAIHIPKNQVYNVNSFRDIMKNVLRMRHAKYEMTDKQTDKKAN